MCLITSLVYSSHRLDDERNHNRKARDIQRTLTSFQGDLDFANDITILTHSFKNMPEKTNVMSVVG
jgi:hypothetical protein